MAVGALEAKIDAVDRRVEDLRDEVRRANDERKDEIGRERSRVDDVWEAQLALSVANAKTQTTIKTWGAIVALVTPMLVALGVWLVLRSFKDPAAVPPPSIATSAPAQAAPAISSHAQPARPAPVATLPSATLIASP